jgi:transposase-like protein
MTNKSKGFELEIQERAVRMVFEHQGEYRSQRAAIESIAAKFGSTPETLRKWDRRGEVDEGYKPGITSVERSKVKDLERENRELKRANEILKAASVFFSTELDGRIRK